VTTTDAAVDSPRADGRPSTPESTGPPAGPPRETLVEKLYAAFPLFVVGGICLVIALDFYFTGAVESLGKNGVVHLQPWGLFFALAVTGLSAGTFTMVVGEDEEPAVIAPAAAPAPARELPEWDESSLASEAPLFPSRRSWEVESEYRGGVTAGGASDQLILNQIDDIAASLRKKPRPPSSS